MSRYKRRKYSLIIPCYWISPELEFMTVTCLNSVNDSTNQIQKIVVNDGSPSKGRISSLHVEYSDLLNKRIDRQYNGGYAAAVNSGLEAAEGDIIIVGNNDLVFPRNWLRELVAVLDAGFDLATCWTSDQKQDLTDPDIKFGSIFAMKREIYDTIGGFDEQFRGYFSDDDYRERIFQAGFTIGRNDSLVMRHQAKATYKITDPNDKEFQRSKLLYEIKYGRVL